MERAPRVLLFGKWTKAMLPDPRDMHDQIGPLGITMSLAFEIQRERNARTSPDCASRASHEDLAIRHERANGVAQSSEALKTVIRHHPGRKRQTPISELVHGAKQEECLVLHTGSLNIRATKAVYDVKILSPGDEGRPLFKRLREIWDAIRGRQANYTRQLWVLLAVHYQPEDRVVRTRKERKFPFRPDQTRQDIVRHRIIIGLVPLRVTTEPGVKETCATAKAWLPSIEASRRRAHVETGTLSTLIIPERKAALPLHCGRLDQKSLRLFHTHDRATPGICQEHRNTREGQKGTTLSRRQSAILEVLRNHPDETGGS